MTPTEPPPRAEVLAAYEALRQSESHYRRLVEASPYITYEFDMVEGATFWSSRIEEVMGWSRELLEADPYRWYAAIVDEDKPAVDRAIQGLSEGRHFDLEYRICNASGEIRWLRDRSIAIIERRGHPIVEGIAEDITERKEAARALEESEARYRMLFDAIPLCLNVFDLEGRLVEVNDASCKTHGYTKEEFLTLPPDSYIHGDARASFEAFMSAASRGEVFTDIGKNIRRNGEVFDLEVVGAPIELDGIAHIIGIGRDLSREQSLEAQLRAAQRMEAVGRLAGGMAHALNNLLTPILGYVGLTLDELPRDAHPRKGLELAARAAERARDLVAKLTAFGRQQTLLVATHDLAEIVRSTIALMTPTVREDVSISVVVRGAPLVVEADAGQLEQVIANVVINACDAIEGRGHIDVRVSSLVPSEAPPRGWLGKLPQSPWACLEIEDDGEGMSPEILSKLFEPFFTTKDRSRGTGLGMSTAHGIVHQHGGQILAKSVEGEGTTISVYLPLDTSTAPRTAASEDHASPIAGGRTVMVVEDEALVRELTVDILEDMGFEVVASSTPREALDLVTRGEVRLDLLLTDVIMPQMNGRELYEAMARLVPGLVVVYMSGHSEEIIASNGVLREGVHFVQKPFTWEELSGKLREALDGP